MQCDRCGCTLKKGVSTIIDGGEFGFGDVCQQCMRAMEHYFFGSRSHDWLDLLTHCLPIRVSNGIELLETTSKPHWYFIRVDGLIESQLDKADAFSRFNHLVAQRRYEGSALNRLANGAL